MDITDDLLKKATEWDRLSRLTLDPAVQQICRDHRSELMGELQARRAEYLNRIISGLDYK